MFLVIVDEYQYQPHLIDPHLGKSSFFVILFCIIKCKNINSVENKRGKNNLVNI